MMARRRASLVIGAAAALFVALLASVEIEGQNRAATAGAQAATPGSQAVLDRYCLTCHNERVKAGALLLNQLDVAQAGRDPQVWEKVVRMARPPWLIFSVRAAAIVLPSRYATGIPSTTRGPERRLC